MKIKLSVKAAFSTIGFQRNFQKEGLLAIYNYFCTIVSINQMQLLKKNTFVKLYVLITIGKFDLLIYNPMCMMSIYIFFKNLVISYCVDAWI